jgi:hypothetical protein
MCLKELGVTNLYEYKYPDSMFLIWSTIPRVFDQEATSISLNGDSFTLNV